LFSKKATRQISKIVIFILCLVFISPGIRVDAAHFAVVDFGEPVLTQDGRMRVPVYLLENPGIGSLNINVYFDSSQLAVGSVVRSSQMALNAQQATMAGHTFFPGPAPEFVNVFFFGGLSTNNVGAMFYIDFTLLTNSPFSLDLLSIDGFALVEWRTATDERVQERAILLRYGEEPPYIPAQTTPPTTPSPTTPAPTTPAPTPPPTEAGTVPPGTWVDNWRPPNIIGGNPIFTAPVAEGAPQARALIYANFTPAAGILTETIVAYRLFEDGEPEMVIAGLFDDESGQMRWLGYPGNHYGLAQNRVNFADINAEGWYYRAIAFAAARDLFDGVGDNRFDPHANMSRAMFVTVLSRLDNIDREFFGIAPFDDVAEGIWYDSAVAWADFENLIPFEMLGTTPNLFRPNQNITREEMAMIFAAYLDARDFPMTAANVPEFYDIGEASPHARAAVQAMRAYGIIRGHGDNTFAPQSLATRAEVAQIFTNMVRAMVGAN